MSSGLIITTGISHMNTELRDKGDVHGVCWMMGMGNFLC
jgi:hypothetical protein